MKQTLDDLEPDDLVKFGMIPEFVGQVSYMGRTYRIN